ncbi:FmdB family zinc ribbon protein [Massilia sp. S19_KUP03_FR1]|uniref:FmdB family zinc ribbon protein n=1 Tax=Massilia sp. S19_KUP03_FR1 TaxID=3025503 RepID=UPI002FCDC328
MPIYAYRCEECGFAKDVLQKLSDPVLTDCPECGKSTFKKQLTAAGFQLKGSGWYVTDFRGGNKPPATGTAVSSGESKAADTKTAESKSSDSAPAAAAAKPAATDSTPK